MSHPAVDSIETLYRTHGPDARRLALRIVRNPAEADEITQHAFTSMPQVIERHNGQGTIRSFILGVVANIARHARRTHARREAMIENLSGEPSPESSDPETRADVRQQARRALEVLQSLPAEQREAFLLSCVGDWSAGEIAAETGVPEATVRTRIFHARRRLREALARPRAMAVFTLVVALVLLVAAAAVAWPLIQRALRGHNYREHGTHHRVYVQSEAPSDIQETHARTRSVPRLAKPSVNTSGSDSVIATHNTSESTTVGSHTRRAGSSARAARLERLYEEAHTLHFHGNAPDKTLEAWNAYLRESPDGRLALEARYNRAITLVRVHRLRDASEALRPFAQAAAHGYRRDEAIALRNALEAKLEATSNASFSDD